MWSQSYSCLVTFPCLVIHNLQKFSKYSPFLHYVTKVLTHSAPKQTNYQELFNFGLKLALRNKMEYFALFYFTLFNCFSGSRTISFQVGASIGGFYMHSNGQHGLSDNHFYLSCHFLPFAVSRRGLHEER